VSFVAGVVTDKFCYHQPLYRQHQRMGDNGIRVSRPWLTQLTHAALSLLEPVYTAQLESIRQSRVKAMDETPIKAGRSGTGKMKGYFWPVYGEHDEICFPYHEGRGGKHIAQTLGADPPPEGRYCSPMATGPTNATRRSAGSRMPSAGRIIWSAVLCGAEGWLCGTAGGKPCSRH
jgi:hypothetical protein